MGPSDSSPVSSAVQGRYPQPIAVAWQRARSWNSARDRLKRLQEALELLLMTLGALLLPDALRGGQPDPQLREWLCGDAFSRPSLGHRQQLLDHLLRVLRPRPLGERVLSEFVGWYPEWQTHIGELVRDRNLDIHGLAVRSDAAEHQVADRIQERMEGLLRSLSWLECFTIFRVRRQNKRASPHQGEIEAYVGTELHPPRLRATWDTADLDVDIVYLAHRERGILELWPFLQVPREGNPADHLFVLSAATSDGRRVVLLDADEGARREAPVDPDRPHVRWSELLAPGRSRWRGAKLGGTLDEERTRGSFLSDRLEHVRELGRGGFAVVHLARDLATGEEVAIKVLHDRRALEPQNLDRIERELRIMSSLDHPNVLRARSERGRGGRLLIRMPFVPGGTLRDRLGRPPRALPEAEVLELTRQLFRGIKAIHDAGIVHRDLKPDNLLMDGETLKISDFGLARPVNDPVDQPALTATGAVLGTPRYRSPEQEEGSRRVGRPSDIYSAAVVIAELLTGMRPAVGARPSEGLTDPWRTLLSRCDARDPEERNTADMVLASIDLLWPTARLATATPTPLLPVGELDVAGAHALAVALRTALERIEAFPQGAAAWGERPLPDGRTVQEGWEDLRARHLGVCWPHLLDRVAVGHLLFDTRRRGFDVNRVWKMVASVVSPSTPTPAVDPNNPEWYRIPARTFPIGEWISALGWYAPSKHLDEKAMLLAMLKAAGVAEAAPAAEALDWGLLLRSVEVDYHRHPARKRGGGRRWIHQPTPSLRAVQRVVASRLLRSFRGLEAATAFLPQRSTALHARIHAAARAAVVVDVHDWFGSVCFDQVKRELSSSLEWAGVTWSGAAWVALRHLCFIGHPSRALEFLPQGAPTSPVLANIAAAPIDRVVGWSCERVLDQPLWRYSRYADDLVISTPFGGHEFHEAAEGLLVRLVRAQRWHVSRHKVRHWSSLRGGPLVLCGIQVPEARDAPLRLPEPVHRRLRAAVHHLQGSSERAEARGLAAYAYAVTGRHALAAVLPGWVRDRVREVALAVAGGRPAVADAFVEGWTADAAARTTPG